MTAYEELESHSKKGNVQEMQVPFALYDAFTSVPYSGSQAGIITHAANIEPSQRVTIAKELGYPAIAFVDSCENMRVKVQFYSAVAELPMCGHGTLCLITRLIDSGYIECPESKVATVTLELPNGEATVQLKWNDNARVDIMLSLPPAKFSSPNINLETLATLLGSRVSDFSDDLPIELASGDFTHLCLPMSGLESIARIRPDYSSLADWCRENGVQTVATFCTEVTFKNMTLHVRDFCPAVGVAESAAAGTTNATLAVYLARHGHVIANAKGEVTVHAEQGIELGRPSQVITNILISNGQITALQVGGVASRVFEGSLYLSGNNQ